MARNIKEPATVPGMSRRDRVSKLLTDIERRFENEASKATLSDYVRFTQLERELDEDDPPKEIKITWVHRREGSFIER